MPINTHFTPPPKNGPALPRWEDLSLREQVGQLVVLHVTQDLGPVKDLESFWQQYPVGGIFGGGEVISDGTNRFEHVAASAKRCQELSKVPLFVAADLENGCGDVIPGLTPLPWPMCLGAANDVDLAQHYGEVTALEGARAGINWALAPMADLNLHPLSSNVGIRAFGDRADHVLPLLRAFTAGVESMGMMACAKTFPGDGSDYRDQHFTTTANQLNRVDWEASYGKVFRGLVADDIASVMTGHFTIPSFQTPQKDGSYLPATLSHEITTGLLKQEMGFKGVVISDAFGMGGILSQDIRVEAAVRSFACGTDVVLWPGLNFIDRVVEEIEAGRIPFSRLEDALRRIWRAKRRFAGIPADPGDVATNSASEVARETARKAITCLWNKGGILPLDSSVAPRILIIGTTPFDKTFGRLDLLRQELERRGFSVDLKRHISPFELRDTEAQYDRILLLVERQFHRPLGPMELFGDESRNLWSCSSYGWQKLVAVGLGSPYLVPWYCPQARAAFNAYSAVPESLKAVAETLCGEVDANGTSPVLYANRFGIKNLSDWREPVC